MGQDIASLGIVVKTSGVTQATADLRGLDKQAAATEKSAISLGKAFGTALGLGAAALVTTGISAIVRNTIEAERAQSQLAAVLRSTGGAAGLNAVQLNAMATALQSVTTFDDEAITGAQSMLLTFTKIGRDVFPQATEAVLNMSQALGQDLKSSAVQLGKALNDPIQGVTALQRVGVSFNDSQKDLIKNLVETGRQAEAQKLILAELETEFGGSARAARETLGGALQGLKNDFGNLLEGSGGNLNDATAAVNDLGAVMRSPGVQQGFAALTSGIALVVEKAVAATAAIANLAAGVDAFGRTAAQAQYDAGLLKEEALRKEIGNMEKEGVTRASFFAANSLQTVGSMREQLALIHKQNEAFRARPVAAAAPNPLAPGTSLFPKTGTVTIRHDEEGFGSGKGKAAMSDAQRAAQQLQQQFDSLHASMAQTIALFGDESEAAKVRYQLEHGELDKLSQDKKQQLLDQAKTLDGLKAEAEETERLNEKEKERQETIKRAHDALQGVLSDMQFELELMGKSNAERVAEIELRRIGIGLTDEERQAARVAIETNAAQIESLHQQVDAMDDFRESFTDAFASVLDGSKSAKEAFKDFADSVVQQIARIIAEQTAASLFGAPGTSQTGSAGGFLSSLFSSLFGGGRAAGGNVSGTKLYEVGEQGAPELFQSKGRTYLIPGNTGRVTPLGAGGGGDTINLGGLHFNGGPVTKENAQYAANLVARKIARARRGG